MPLLLPVLKSLRANVIRRCHSFNTINGATKITRYTFLTYIQHRNCCAILWLHYFYISWDKYLRKQYLCLHRKIHPYTGILCFHNFTERSHPNVVTINVRTKHARTPVLYASNVFAIQTYIQEDIFNNTSIIFKI